MSIDKTLLAKSAPQNVNLIPRHNPLIFAKKHQKTYTRKRNFTAP